MISLMINKNAVNQTIIYGVVSVECDITQQFYNIVDFWNTAI